MAVLSRRTISHSTDIRTAGYAVAVSFLESGNPKAVRACQHGVASIAFSDARMLSADFGVRECDAPDTQNRRIDRIRDGGGIRVIKERLGIACQAWRGLRNIGFR